MMGNLSTVLFSDSEWVKICSYSSWFLWLVGCLRRVAAFEFLCTLTHSLTHFFEFTSIIINRRLISGRTHNCI